MLFPDMDENTDPSKQPADTPTPEVEQLLRILEAQRMARRERGMPAPAGFQGVTFRWGSIAVIIVFALGSVGLMEWMVSQLPKPTPTAPVVGPVMAPVRATATPSKK